MLRSHAATILQTDRGKREKEDFSEPLRAAECPRMLAPYRCDTLDSELRSGVSDSPIIQLESQCLVSVFVQVTVGPSRHPSERLPREGGRSLKKVLLPCCTSDAQTFMNYPPFFADYIQKNIY